MATNQTFVDFVTPVPADWLNNVNNTVNWTTPLTGGTQQPLTNKVAQTVSAKDFGAKGDGVTNDAPAINLALATGHPVFLPQGTYLLNSTLTIAPNGGLIGEGEGTILQRNFTGGRLIGYPGGAPIYIKNFQITTNGAITVVNGDTGIDIGYSTAWAQRGEIANLLIQGQWDGFKWSGGAQGGIQNVWALSNKGNGFLSLGGRGEMYDCLAEFNAGHGYYFVAQTGETGIQLVNCGTFANKGWGFLYDAAVSVSGANIWMSSCSSSYDGQGGIGFVQPYAQIWISEQLIEQAGNANAFQPSFPILATAPGLFITNGCTAININNILVQNCQGSGVTLDTINQFVMSNMQIRGNGAGLQGGSNQSGLNVSTNCTNGMIAHMIVNQGANQTTDVAFGASNTVTLIEPFFRTYSNASNSAVTFFGRNTTATLNLASQATITLWDYTDVFNITGNTTITSLATTAPTLFGRKITLILPSGITISNAGNIKLTSSLTTTAITALTLTTDGTNWYQG